MPVSAPTPLRRRAARAGIVAALVLVAACCAVLRPLVLHGRSQVIDTRHYYRGLWSVVESDIWLTTWILAWDSHILPRRPAGLFDANAYHPTPAVLARSEHMLGLLPIFAPVYALTGEPMAALNAVLLGSFVLSALAMFALLRHASCGVAIAGIGALAWAFVPWRVHDGFGRVHLLQYQYLPFVVLTLDRALSTGRPAALVGFFLAFTLQCLTTYLHAYEAFACVAALLVLRASLLRTGRGRSTWCRAVLPATVVAGIVSALSLSYLRLARAGAYAPRIWASAHVGTYVQPGIVLPELTWLALAATLCLPIAVRSARGRRATTRRGRRLAGYFVAIAAAGVLLSFGEGTFNRIAYGPDVPGLDLLSIPYRVVAATVPGFAHLRDPYRFLTLASLGIVGLAALAADWVARAAGRWAPPARRAVLAAAGLWLGVRLAAVDVRLRPPIVPLGPRPVDTWLAEHGDGGPVLELPTSRDRRTAYVDAIYMYASTFHWLPLVNGFTGHPPPTYERVRRLAAALPAPAALTELRAATGLRWIVRHDAAAGAWDPRSAPGLRRVGRFGEAELWDAGEVQPAARHHGPRRATPSARVSAVRE